MRMLYWLCDGEAFSPRWVCGAFEGGLGWVSIATSLLLALAYLGMCGLMSRQIRRAVAASLPTWPLLCSCLLFLACAVGHLFAALAYFWPAYRLFVAWDVLSLFATLPGLLGVLAMYRWALVRIQYLLLRQEVAQQLALQKPSVPCPVQTQAWAEAASNSLDQALSTLRGQV